MFGLAAIPMERFVVVRFLLVFFHTLRPLVRAFFHTSGFTSSELQSAARTDAQRHHQQDLQRYIWYDNNNDGDGAEDDDE